MARNKEGKIVKWLGRNLLYEVSRNIPMGITVIDFYLGERKVGEIEVFDIDLERYCVRSGTACF